MKAVSFEYPLPVAHFLQMESAARSCGDQEACGLLYQDGYIPLPNIAAKETEFFADPTELARILAGRGEPLAVFHTHPNGDLSPSARDLERCFYINSTMIIGTLQKRQLRYRAYRIG